MKYKKITASEFDEIVNRFGGRFIKPSPVSYEVKNYIQKYYPPEADSILITYNSEYNDNTYDVSVQYVGVYDANQNELLPVKETAREARSKWNDIFNYTGGYWGEGPSEPASDKVIHLNAPSLPELYVKVL